MLAVDCATTFGSRPERSFRGDPEALVARLAAGGVRGALTTSRRGVLYDHRQGNEETLRVCRRHRQLIPAATINLTRYLDWEADVDWCLAQGFRAFRLFPDEQRWSVAGLAFRRLCERLAPAHCPLLLAHPGSERDALELAACTADLEIPVVLLHGSYANEATSVHLLQRYPNLHLDVARRATPHAVRFLADTCGVARVLFGSDAPEQCVQPALNAVFAADLPAEDTEQILSGNLLRLLGETSATLPFSGDPPLADEPRFRGYVGPTIDVHAHLGPWRFPIRTHTTETVLAYARRYRLENVVVSSALGIVYDFREGNQQLEEWIAPHPELLGYVVVNPNFVDASAAELDRYYREPGFVGAKIHGEYSHTATAAPQMARLFEEIARRGRPVKIHNAGPDWQPALRELARKHRQLPIIIAHGGGWGTGPFMRDEPNVFLEYCGSGSIPGLIEEGLASVGADRLLFGTDQDLFDPGYALGKYWEAGFTPAQAEKVMYANARRLFGLP